MSTNRYIDQNGLPDLSTDLGRAAYAAYSAYMKTHQPPAPDVVIRNGWQLADEGFIAAFRAGLIVLRDDLSDGIIKAGAAGTNLNTTTAARRGIFSAMIDAILR